MNITDIITPAAVAAYFNETGRGTPYIGEGFFTPEKKAGLDLTWLKGNRGLPISLMPSAFDAKATFRDRIGVTRVETEMPFFREGYKIKERDRQEILRAAETGDAYLMEAIARIYDDAGDLLEGANVAAERERMQLLFPVGGNVGISIVANGVDYTYNYDPTGAWKAANYSELTSTAKWDAPSTADPIATLQTIQRGLASASGAMAAVVLMNGNTFAKYAACAAVLNRVRAAGAGVSYITDTEAANVLYNSLGLRVAVYDRMYKDESGVSHSFIPDGYVTVLPEGPVGKTFYGTTPEEADLMGSGKADVQIVNTGVAITRTVDEHPVNVNIFASEIVLPSYERMDEVACCKVF